MSWINSITEVALGPRVYEERLKEKRVAPRITCNFPAEFIGSGGRALGGSIVDLEHTGMRGILDGRVKKGEHIGVSLKEPARIIGKDQACQINMVFTEVVWCRKKRHSVKYNAGLRFTDEPAVLADSWVALVLSSFGIADAFLTERRRKIRLRTSIAVVCHYGEDRSSSGMVYDLGLDGVKMRLPDAVREQETVMLDIGPFKFFPVIRCSARVLRVSDSPRNNRFEIGAEFEDLTSKQVKILGRIIKELIQDSSI